MTEQQIHHAQKLADEFKARMTIKYAKGAREHGGNIWDIGAASLLDNAIDEAIDQVVYLLTLKQKLYDYDLQNETLRILSNGTEIV